MKDFSESERRELAKAAHDALQIGKMSITDAVSYYSGTVKPLLDRIGDYRPESLKDKVNRFAEDILQAARDKLNELAEQLARRLAKEAKSLAKMFIVPGTIHTFRSRRDYLRMQLKMKAQRLYDDLQIQLANEITKIDNQIKNVGDTIEKALLAKVESYKDIVGQLIAGYTQLQADYDMLEEAVVKVGKEARDAAKVCKLPEDPLYIVEEKARELKDMFHAKVGEQINNIPEIWDEINKDIRAEFELDIYGTTKYERAAIPWTMRQPLFAVEFACLTIVIPLFKEAVNLLIQGAYSKNHILFREGIYRFSYVIKFCSWCAEKLHSDIFNTMATIMNPLKPLASETLEKLMENIRINKAYIAGGGIEKEGKFKENISKGNPYSTTKKKDAAQQLCHSIQCSGGAAAARYGGNVTPSIYNTDPYTGIASNSMNPSGYITDFNFAPVDSSVKADPAATEQILSDYKYIGDMLEPTGSEIIDRLNLLNAGKDIITLEELKAKREKKRQDTIKVTCEMSKMKCCRSGYKGKSSTSSNTQNNNSNNTEAESDPSMPETDGDPRADTSVRHYPNRVAIEDLLYEDPCLPINPLCPVDEDKDKQEPTTDPSCCINAIIEFDYSIKDYSWAVGPGSKIDKDTIIGYFTDKDENGNLYKRTVRSPFTCGCIDAKEYKVLDKDFDRHYVFRCVKFKDEDEAEKEEAEQIQNKLKKAIDDVCNLIDTNRPCDNFFTYCFEYFLRERIYRCGGSEKYADEVFEELGYRMDDRCQKMVDDIKAIENKCKGEEDADSDFENMCNGAYDIKFQCVNDLYETWKRYDNINAVPSGKYSNSYIGDRVLKRWKTHDTKYVSDEHEDMVKFLIELPYIDCKKQNYIPVRDVKPNDEENSDCDCKEALLQLGYSSSLITNCKEKTIHESEYHCITHGSGDDIWIDCYDDSDMINVLTESRYVCLDRWVDSVFKKYMETSVPTLDDFKNITKNKFKEFTTLDRDYIFDKKDFFDLDILGTIYKYHLIAGYERLEASEKALDAMGFGDYPGSDYPDVSGDDFTKALSGIGEMNNDEAYGDADDIYKNKEDNESSNSGNVNYTRQPLHEKYGLKKQSKDYGYDKYKYWLRHMSLDTICAVVRFVKWFQAGPVPIMAPVVYMPIIVFKIPVMNCTCVIGIGIAGLGTYPLVLIVNPDSIEKSWMIPLTLMLDIVYNTGKTAIRTAKDTLEEVTHVQENLLRAKILMLDQVYKKLENEEREAVANVEAQKQDIYNIFNEAQYKEWTEKAREITCRFDEIVKSLSSFS